MFEFQHDIDVEIWPISMVFNKLLTSDSYEPMLWINSKLRYRNEAPELLKFMNDNFLPPRRHYAGRIRTLSTEMLSNEIKKYKKSLTPKKFLNLIQYSLCLYHMIMVKSMQHIDIDDEIEFLNEYFLNKTQK